MNNKIILGIVVVVILVAGGFFLFKSKTNTPPASIPSPAMSDNDTMPASGNQTSLKGLMAAGLNQTCTFSDTENNTTSQGTVYVTTGHFRGDFTAQVSGNTQVSHMISDGVTSYVWMDGQATGMKMKFDSTAQPASGQPGSVDTSKNMDFNCNTWTVDESLFTVPANIQFTDMTASMQSSDTQSMPSIESACAQLAEPARTQCMNSSQ